MRRISLISTGILLLFLGAVAPASANQDQRDQGSQTQKQEQTKPEGQQQAKPEEQKQATPEAQQQKPQMQAKPARQEQRQQPKTQPEQAKSNSKQQEQQAQSVKQEQQNQARSQQVQTKQNSQQRQQQAQVGRHRQQSASSRPPQRTEEEQTRQRAEPSLRLSAMNNSRIPDARFRSNFGRTHEFRIGSPRMVDGYSRFQYGGYWFGFVQPWPANWYYSDGVYVDYINGRYYLCNPYYPGVKVAISVVM